MERRSLSGLFGRAGAVNFLEPEYAEPYQAWKSSPSPENAGKLLHAVKPVLATALKTYVPGESSPTMHSHAKILALGAFQRYDPGRAKLRTHLMSHLQSLRRLSARESQIISLPERVAIQAGRLRDARTELEDRLGRPASLSELADHTGLPPKRVALLQKAKPGLAEGQTRFDDEDGGENESAPAVVKSNHTGWESFIYHGLNPTDQLIFEHTSGLHGVKVLPKNEIAKKLGVTPGAVSQRLHKIQKLLDMREETGLF